MLPQPSEEALRLRSLSQDPCLIYAAGATVIDAPLGTTRSTNPAAASIGEPRRPQTPVATRRERFGPPPGVPTGTFVGITKCLPLGSRQTDCLADALATSLSRLGCESDEEPGHDKRGHNDGSSEHDSPPKYPPAICTECRLQPGSK